MTEASRHRVAVTGASGYLGSRICTALTSSGWEVRRLVRAPSPTDPASCRFTLGEPVSPDALSSVDVLVHAAYDLSVTSREDIRRINVGGTRQLLDAAAAAGVPRIIVLSSMSAYAGTTQLYGRAKLAIERMTVAAGGCAIRPAVVYGDSPGGMAGSLRKLTVFPIAPTIAGGSRIYTVHEDDLMRAISALAAAGSLPPGIVSIAHPDPVPFSAFMRGLATRHVWLVPVPWPLVYAALRAVEAMGLHAPFRADSLLGLVKGAPGVEHPELIAELGVALRPFAVADQVPSPPAPPAE